MAIRAPDGANNVATKRSLSTKSVKVMRSSNCNVVVKVKVKVVNSTICCSIIQR